MILMLNLMLLKKFNVAVKKIRKSPDYSENY